MVISLNVILTRGACPVEDDPTNLARCVQVDVTAIVYAARGKDDITSLCALADRYMECFKTYSRGCVGYHVIIKKIYPKKTSNSMSSQIF